MKKVLHLKILFILLLSFSVFQVSSQNSAKSAKEEMLEIYEKSDETSVKIKTDVNSFFALAKKPIAQADKISNRLKKKTSELNNQPLAKEEIERTVKDIRELHNIYTEIDDNRELFYKILNNYDKDIEVQVASAKALVKKYQKMLEEFQSSQQELLMKNEKSAAEQQDFEFNDSNIQLVKKIIASLENFQTEIEAFKRGYEKTNTEIALFFNTVKNCRVNSGLLRDFFELTLEFDKIIENSDNIASLKDLTKDIQMSLKGLSNTVIELKKSANSL